MLASTQPQGLKQLPSCEQNGDRFGADSARKTAAEHNHASGGQRTSRGTFECATVLLSARISQQTLRFQ